ncbi:unnamed protein product, partial [Coregonus sp. 'balchen']
MESSININAMTRLHKAEIMIAVEQLRLRLHDGKLIKDQRYNLRTYPNCFVAQELTDWLISHKEAPDGAMTVCLMQHLMDHDICPMFKDAKLLYRFCKADGTFPFNTKVKVRGQRFVITGRDSILQLREAQGVAYQRSFPSCQLIDWLLQNGDRKQAPGFGALPSAYILSEILNETEREKKEGVSVPAQEDNHANSPFVLNKIAQQEDFNLVMGDAVGWGFVVRGMAPVYIQAVDPVSPAVAAGDK